VSVSVAGRSSPETSRWSASRQFCDVRVDESWAMHRPRTMNNKGVVSEYRKPKLAYEVVRRHFMAQCQQE
jgi:hypothetical protein